MRQIYLDFNATTPLLPEAWEAMRPLMAENFGNPSSPHYAGRKARQALEDARERIAFLLGAFPDEVTFTSGATEANNLAIFGLLDRPHLSSLSPHSPTRSPPGRAGKDLLPLSLGERGLGNEGEKPLGAEDQPLVLASHLEHPCVVEPLRQLEANGIPVEWLPASSRGILLIDAVRAALNPCTRYVCVMLANHETGAIQPVGEIASVLPQEIALHCDAAQAVGKIPVNFQHLGATTLTASGHKFGGPKGIGVLLTKRGTRLTPRIFGGHQQRGLRPGTEAVPLVVGMAIALECAVSNLDAHRAKLENFRERFWMRLRELAAPFVLNGPEIDAVDVLPTTLNVSFPGCRADLLLMALDLAGVACSTGSACSSGSLLPSPVLTAMGIPEEALRSALRFSFGPMLELSDIDEAAQRIGSVVSRARM